MTGVAAGPCHRRLRALLVRERVWYVPRDPRDEISAHLHAVQNKRHRLEGATRVGGCASTAMRPQVVRVEIPRGSTDRPSVRCRGNELGRTVNASSRRLEPVSYVPCRPCHPSALWRLCPAMGPAARARARQCMAGEKIKKGGAMCGDESAPCSRTLALRCAPSLRIW
jgi:hypothetical protein